MKSKNFYFEEFKKLVEARKESSIYGIREKLTKNEPRKIQTALLNFFTRLEKLIQNPNLKYRDLSLFVIDHKFLFPHKNTTLTLEKGGPTLIINTQGLLYELFKAIDLVEYFDLIIELQEVLSDLHGILSKGEKVEKYKKNVFEVIKKIKNLLTKH